MADVAVENKETPVVEKKEVEKKEVEKKEEKTPKKVVADVDEKPAENGSTEEETKENGEQDKEKPTTDDSAEEETNGDSEDKKDDEEETNGDSTDAPATESVKRKVTADADKKAEDAATPEKKAKLDDSTKEVESNGAEATEVAA